MFFGLIFGLASSVWVARSAHDHQFASALPSPWVTACLGLGVIALGWLTATVVPRFAAAFATGAFPGALYATLVLAGDGTKQLAYGWSTMPIALGALALGAGIHSAQHPTRPWSARRGTSSRVPR